MPKISEERRAERREQILAGARRCFAANGYEGATVAKLELKIGLSRGAIFNYFGSKESLRRACRAGQRAAVSPLGERRDRGSGPRGRRAHPEWLGVYLELIRRIRNDEDFKRRIEERQERVVVPVNRAHAEIAQRTGELRDDISIEELGQFLNLVVNGLALQRAAATSQPPSTLSCDC